MHTIAAVDLGKSRCRVVVVDAGERRTLTGTGSPGLATPDGVETALAAILPLTEQAGRFDRIGVGVAGAWGAPGAAADLAERLAVMTCARGAVTSDVVTAHLGALEGTAGTLLIAGTGAAAFGVDGEGIRLIDGWGPDIGDLGSGSWLGREGVRAALRARDGLGERTALSDAIAEHIAPAGDAVAWLAAGTPTARQLATVAPLVLDAAEAGDQVSVAIAAEAVHLLTASAVAASAEPEVVLHGGLTDHAWFRAALDRSLTTAGRTVVSARGDALDGAALLARRTDTFHERFVHRA